MYNEVPAGSWRLASAGYRVDFTISSISRAEVTVQHPPEKLPMKGMVAFFAWLLVWLFPSAALASSHRNQASEMSEQG